MYSRQLEQIASQRTTELRAARAATASPAPATPARQRKPIRTRTGWALVAVGLRLAASGSR